MSETIRDARRRIRRVRMRDVEAFVLRGGQPVPGARVSFRMKNHQFLFGAVCYSYGKLGGAENDARFTQLFTDLFNYTMMPFHWNWYEPKRGVYNEPYTGNLVDWADAHALKKKLHALIWHECCPDWVTDGDVRGLYDERISYLMRRYGDRFDFFDLVNETTVNDRFDNPVSRWVRAYGPINVMKFGAALVRSYKPDAKLIYGDWNVHGEEYTNMLRAIRDANVDIDLIGLQSHMHRDLWSEEETLRVMDNAARFGFPIHFPECSICSGKPIGDMSYLPGAVNRFSETEEDLYWQADFARDFYTLVFSHPAVEALSWFDFTDHRWLGAPAGLLDDDLNPKPAYRALRELIHGEWHSDTDAVTGETGVALTRLFCGTYEITVESGGRRTVFTRDIHRESFYGGGGEPRRLTLSLEEGGRV